MPEIAQVIYCNMLINDKAVGDYTSDMNSSIKVTEEIRFYMITVIL